MSADLHQTALAQVRDGDMQAALESFEACLKDCPDNGFVWNDAAVVLYVQGRVEDAVRYFRRAVELDRRPRRAAFNLVQAYAASGRAAQAMPWIETLARDGLLDAALVGRIAESFIAQKQLSSAMDALHRGRQRLSDTAALDTQIDALRSKRAKIAFFVGGDGPTFLNAIIDYTRRRYPVRLFDGKTTEDLHQLMRWSDISWFEWCTTLAVAASKMPKVCRTIVRLHRYEAYETYPMQINWGRIDTLITVGNSFVLKALNARAGDVSARTSIVRIPNGVDLDAIPFTPRRAGKNLAFVGNLRMVKNPMLLLACMAALKAVDGDYRLFIAGRMEDLLLKQYFEHAIQTMGLGNNIICDGYQRDITGWLADKQYIISTSVIESQGMGILEAMACGIKPVIHHFPGAEEIFGSQHLFTTPDDFCRLVRKPDYNSEDYRTFVERRYPLSQQLLRIDELFSIFEKNPFQEQSAAGSENAARLTALAV